MSDQPSANQSTQEISPEMADFFQVDVKKQEGEVKADDKAEIIASETTEDIKETTETTKKEGEDVQPKEGEDVQPTEFEVAGKKYNNLEDAIKAVNSIAGKNTNLSGEVNELKFTNKDLSKQLEEVNAKLLEYAEANEKWQKYYNGEDAEIPKDVNIDEIIEKKLTEVEKKKAQKEIQKVYSQELDEILDSEEYTTNEKLRETFHSFVDEYDGTPNVNPKKLWERAKLFIKEDSTKDLEAIQKEIEEKVRKELLKGEALKTVNSNGGGKQNDVNNPLESMSPEMLDFFQQRI